MLKINKKENENSEEKEGKEEVYNKVRKNSQNNMDNEEHKILEKEVTNNTIEIESPININQERKKKFFHDKDITEDSIIYFTNKLKNNNRSYKLYLYISIFTYTIDIVSWFFNNTFLHNYLHLLTSLFILISVIIQVFLFRNNFEPISKQLYITIQIIIYIYIIIITFFIIDKLFVFYNLFLNGEITKKNFELFDFRFLLFIYVGINISISLILLMKLFLIKKSIKDLSAARGEIYESVKIEDVQVINSIINES